MKILVECHHGIGDVVMTFPALKQIRELFPNAEITYMGGQKSEVSLLMSTGLADRVCIYNVKKERLQDLVRLGTGLRGEHFDLGISFGGSPRGLDVLFLKLSGCKKIVAKKNPNAVYKKYVQIDVPENMHRVLQFATLVQSMGGPARIDETTVHLNPLLIHKIVKKYDIKKEEKWIGLVIGTGDFMYRKGKKITEYNTKKWGLEKFSALADGLMKAGYRVMLLGGEKEKRECALEKISFPKETVSLLGETKLLSTIAAMTRCRLIIGGDTGPMHCAAAAGVLTLTLFGPTDRGLVGPYGAKAHGLYGKYPCIKCYSENNCKGRTCYPAKCMQAISVDAVYHKAMEII